MLLFLLKTKGINLDGIIDDRNMELFGKIIDHLDSESKYNLLLKIAEKGTENLFRYVTFLTYKDVDVHRCYDRIFRTLCKNGHLDMARFFYFFNDDIDVHACDDDAFKTSCYNGHLKTVKWLYHLTNGKLNIRKHKDDVLKSCCITNNLELAQWLYSKFKDGHINDEVLFECFKDACSIGNIDMAKWLLNISTKHENKLDIHKHREVPFNNACSNGHLDMCKFLLTIDGNINIHCTNEWAFAVCCMNGHKQMADWLLSHDIDEDVNDAFVYACIGGQLEVAKYLYNSGKVTDLKYKDEDEHKDPFVHACNSGNLELVQWLYSLENSFYNWCKSFIVTKDTDEERYKYAFINCCKSGNLELVKWFHETLKIELNYKIESGNDYSTFIASPFIMACKYGNIAIVQYLLTNCADINILDNKCESLRVCCIYRQFEMFKMLIGQGQDIVSELNLQELFIHSCSNYNYELSKYIYSLGPDRIDIHADSEKAFRNYCSIGELEGAKWLYNLSVELGNPINIRIKNTAICGNYLDMEDHIFLEACENNKIELATWLTSLCYDYCFETKNSNIVNYRVI